MEITTFKPEYLPAAAGLFIDAFRREQGAVPALPGRFSDPTAVMAKLSDLFRACPGAFAFEGGKLVGFLGWFLINNLRGAGRRAAYCPEWGHAVTAHAALNGATERAYRALYRAASTEWRRQGCAAHAISILAHETEAVQAWFWNGFGLTVVDALRPITPLGAPVPEGVELRLAQTSDSALLAELEAEHWEHYTRPPVLMNPPDPRDRSQFAEFLYVPGNRVALALADGAPVGYITFEGSSDGAADIVADEGTIAITGAFTRPGLRGRGLGAAMLDLGLREYAALGCRRCAVDFESFNPEAAAFWTKHFTPVTYSLIRVPERA